MIRGHAIRCEGEDGHDSAHFGEHAWWPNENGLPETELDRANMIGWILTLIVGILAVAIIYLVFHR